MKEAIKQFVVENLGFLPQEVIVVIVSALPILELRGGLPLAYTFDFPFLKALFLSLLGNALPIIPLLLLFQPLSNWLMRFNWYKRFYDWLYHRTLSKSKNVEKYGAIGLILFTAVPLPTTGAYSACVAAALFAIRFKYAFLSILTGVVIAGLGVGIAMYSIF
ncbi:COG2426 family protein [Guptibacillus hwajinpoensis]|uniref:Ligand-binding protein SH3 n=2 Tax=Guptibacillus hwajinpoensis TaxID=208199 RepID=A0A0J6CWJ7_9BACL|nr:MULTISPECIES: small multi-drug export protein [Alkalihalobacillus]KMM37545.1 ligand-binding protein SH3 [Alkalihalobacillus macyae]MDQ0481471.1 putative membrane protein [Alkalihalobacillus hemicentroti]